MSLLNKLLQAGRGVAAQINPRDGGKTYQTETTPAQQVPQNPLHRLLNSQPQHYQALQYRPTINAQGDPTGYPGAPEVPMGKDPFSYGYPTEITVDPTGRSPYSARTPELARLGNQYVANPYNRKFIGVDPKQFGYPADNASRRF